MIRINLLKPEKREIRETSTIAAPVIRGKKKPSLFGLIYLLLIVILVVLFINQKNILSNEQELLQAVQREKQELKDVETKLQELENQKNLLERKINLINDLKARQDIAVKIMDELSRNIPDWVWLNEASFSGREIQIKGRALSNNLIADYIFNLEESPYFHNVELISSTQRRERNDQFLEFSLTLNYILDQDSISQPTDEPKRRGR